MNYRKKTFIIITVLIIIAAVSYYYTLHIVDCNKLNNYTCSTWFFDELIPFSVITPLFISASLLFIIFFSERIFNIWKKFAVFAVPIMLFLILITKQNPPECGGMFCINQTFVIFFTGILYLVVSILVTIISALIVNNNNKNLKQ